MSNLILIERALNFWKTDWKTMQKSKTCPMPDNATNTPEQGIGTVATKIQQHVSMLGVHDNVCIGIHGQYIECNEK